MASHRTHRGCAGHGRRLRDPDRRWHGAPALTSDHFWLWVLSRLSDDERARLHAWWVTDMARHNPTAEWAGSSAGRRGTWTGQEPVYMSARHWSIRGAENREDFVRGIDLRREAAASRCDTWARDTAKPRLAAIRPTTGFTASEERSILEILNGVPHLRTGFMEAYNQDTRNTWVAEKRALAWLFNEMGVMQQE